MNSVVHKVAGIYYIRWMVWSTGDVFHKIANMAGWSISYLSKFDNSIPVNSRPRQGTYCRKSRSENKNQSVKIRESF